MNKSRLLFGSLAGMLVIGLLLVSCAEDDNGGANTAPVMDSISGPDLVVPSGTATFAGSASDDDGDDLTYTFSAASGSFSGAVWSPPSTDGVYTITCVANDGEEDSEPLTTEIVVASVPDYAYHWSFNGDGLEAVVGEDVVVPSSADFAAGHVGQAIMFNSTPEDPDDAAFGTDAPSLAGADDFSFSLWFATDVEDEMGFLFGKTLDGWYLPEDMDNPGLGSAKGLIMYVDATTGEIELSYDNSWVDGFGGLTTATTDGSWHQAVVTHVGASDTYTIYCDADTVASVSFGGETNPDVSTVITMGNAFEEEGAGEWPGAYHGYMDEVVYWDVVLTATQVATLYNAHD